jgi:acyl carrier protein phosphodiesterase
MNYLAHLYLAEDTEESRLGNLLGDFVKGHVADSPYSPGIRKGIKTHRKVDVFTDSHRKFLESKKLISPERRRFAGVIIDLTFDHFLAKNWKSYSNRELGSFTQGVYGMLMKNRSILPLKLVTFLPRMIQEDWLGSYEKLGGVSVVIERISRRLERKFKRQNTLQGASREIEANYRELERNFEDFFPELITFVENYRNTALNQH